MMKIIADSSADVKAVEGVCFESVPMTIRAGEREFVDDEQLNTGAMLDHLAAHTGPSGTACPSIERWMSAFAGADEIFVVCITSNLSGTWSSAMAARELYLQSHPGMKIHVFDTLSTGPEMLLTSSARAGPSTRSAKPDRNIFPPRTCFSACARSATLRRTGA